jgi:hypothetical protein
VSKAGKCQRSWLKFRLDMVAESLTRLPRKLGIMDHRETQPGQKTPSSVTTSSASVWRDHVRVLLSAVSSCVALSSLGSLWMRLPRNGDPWRPRREGKRLPPRRDGAVVLIDRECGDGTQQAAQCNVVGVSMPHNQDRVRIMTPVEQYASAVKKWLARGAQDLGLAFQRSLKLVGI